MPAYFDTGFAVREPSWHAKEALLTEAPTLETWLTAAGLEWEPTKVPLYLPATIVGSSVNTDGVREFTIDALPRESGTHAVVRSDRLHELRSIDPNVRDRAILARGVSDDYEPIEHRRDMTPLLEAFGQACNSMGLGWEFTTAGAVNDGRKVYACLQLDRPITVPGDQSLTLPYGVLLNSHDGTGACRGGVTAVRVVCANTFHMAEAELDGSRLDFSIRHSGNVEDRLVEARRQIAGWITAVESYESMTAELASVTFRDDLVGEWLDEFLPIDRLRMTDRQIANREAERVNWTELYFDSPTQTGVTGSAYGVWCATVEYLDHVRPWRSADAYMKRTMLEPVPAKSLARTRILELADA